MSQPWLIEARKNIGVKELKGQATSVKIANWLKSLKAWWTDDETPWCGTFAAHCIRTANLSLPKHWYRAKDWLNWGQVLVSPAVGSVVVFDRVGGGHVGFIVGKDKVGNLLVLGGNQGDAVNVRAFPLTRVSGYRWPKEVPLPLIRQLPILVAGAELSTNEA